VEIVFVPTTSTVDEGLASVVCGGKVVAGKETAADSNFGGLCAGVHFCHWKQSRKVGAIRH
jgi:hypothetical protein